MTRTTAIQTIFAAALLAALAAPSLAQAQREVNWQVNSKGFPDDVSVFADVSDKTMSGASFNPNLDASAFAISVDEYAGEQGGTILNANQPNMRGGRMGGQVLIMIDKSRSYTKDFDKMKKMASAIANGMNPAIDQVALAVFPTGSGYSESKLVQNFTSNKNAVKAAVNAVEYMPKDDETGGRFCNALAEGLEYFPQNVNNKYRLIIFLSGGADKSEGKGNCVQDSYAAGKVPFYSMIFQLDRKYDDKRNAHKIENAAHDLALNTGGQSIFRRSEGEMAQFIAMLWNRVHSQYYLQVTFPCYRPAPYLEHTSVLKVEGQDADGIKYQAASHPSPKPVITAIYPQQAYRNAVDDGMDLTIDGKGFCGHPGQVKAYVGGRAVQIKSQMPYRIVASTNSNLESGKIKVGNRFGESGESPMKFDIVEPPKGAEASSTLMYLIIGLVGLVVIAVLIVALKSRKAKVPKGAPPSAPAPQPSGQVPGAPAAPAPKTVAMESTPGAYVQRIDGSQNPLGPGDNIIGREAHCRIKLEVAGVSREHAKITINPTSGLAFVEDLNSTNGTFWGPADATEAQLVKIEQPRQINSGETVWIGGEKLTLVLPAGAPKEG